MEHPSVCQVVSKGKNPIDSWICNGGQPQGTISNSHKKKEVKVLKLDKEELTNLNAKCNQFTQIEKNDN